MLVVEARKVDTTTQESFEKEKTESKPPRNNSKLQKEKKDFQLQLENNIQMENWGNQIMDFKQKS